MQESARRLLWIAATACGGTQQPPAALTNHSTRQVSEIHVAFATTQQAADTRHELVFAAPHRLASAQATVVQLEPVRLSPIDVHEVTTFLSREYELSELDDRPPPMLYAGPLPAGESIVMPGSTAVLYDSAGPAALVPLTVADRAAVRRLSSPLFHDVENPIEPGVDLDGDGHADLVFLQVCMEGPPPDEPEAEVCSPAVFVARRDAGGWVITSACAEETRTRCHRE